MCVVYLGLGSLVPRLIPLTGAREERKSLGTRLGPGIEEQLTVYALCCQLSEALEKTEVGPYHKYEYT